MTKFKGLSKDCSSSALILQLREQPEGGDLLPEVHQKPSAPSARNEIFVLVHGFNNHMGEAWKAYNGFCRRQYGCADPPLVPHALEEMLADLFWPGDAAWGLFDFLDRLVYPESVDTALHAASRLAQHLRKMPSLRTVHFIGHSLGCRLVLETIEDLRENGGPRVGKVCLMAAAVPVFKIVSDGVLANAMSHAREVCVLYSSDDSVLRYAFPVGQATARGDGDEGFLPEALGLHGNTSGASGRITKFLINRAGHGDYWGHSKRKPASDAARALADFCGFGSRSRTIAARSPGAAPRPSTAESRELSYARTI